jgi:uncharacterized phiE125 gp8 family phage protein
VRYEIRAVTPAAEIPLLVSVPDAKIYLRVDGADEDALIASQVLESMEMVERFTGHVLTPRDLELRMDGFPVLPELISIPRDPVTEIYAIKFTDPDSGAEVEMEPTGWRWADSAADQVLPAWRASWPVSADEAGSVRVAFKAGYGDGLCPRALVAAVKTTLAQLYDQRGACIGLSAEVKRDLRGLRPSLA